MSNSTFLDFCEHEFGRREPKIIGVGLNYVAHTDESGIAPPQHPLLFGKFANTLIANGEAIFLPPSIGHVDAEAELAVIIGRQAHNISENDADDVIFGYTCANDVSAREAQFGDGQWFRGKGYDSFCPAGPRVVPRDHLNPSDLRIQQRLNGQLLQDSRTSQLIFTVPKLVSYVSHVLTLERGDMILTGTPEGIGFLRDPKVSLQPGDVVEIEIDGIGILRNEVHAAS